LNRTWRPTLCVTGVAGFPTLEKAGTSQKKKKKKKKKKKNQI